MISVKIGMIGNEELTFHQIETTDNLKELGLPDNTFFFWENEKGERILSPYQIISKIQKSFMDGTFDASSLLNAESIRKHYNRLYQTQKNTTIKSLQDLKQEYIKMGAPKDMLTMVDEHIKMYDENFLFPEMDGSFVPESTEQAAFLSGGIGNLKILYGEDEIKTLFGGKK